jgi:hypothetical protein
MACPLLGPLREACRCRTRMGCAQPTAAAMGMVAKEGGLARMLEKGGHDRIAWSYRNAVQRDLAAEWIETEWWLFQAAGADAGLLTVDKTPRISVAHAQPCLHCVGCSGMWCRTLMMSSLTREGVSMTALWRCGPSVSKSRSEGGSRMKEVQGGTRSGKGEGRNRDGGVVGGRIRKKETERGMERKEAGKTHASAKKPSIFRYWRTSRDGVILVGHQKRLHLCSTVLL